LWEAIFSAIADELYAAAGYLTVRLTAPVAPGDIVVTVESTHRFPDAGRLALGGVLARYTGRTTTTFTGVTNDDLSALDVVLAPPGVVMDISRENTQLDDLRASFILATAEDSDLDVIGRNYGLRRPRGLGDTAYRDFLQVAIFLEAQTIWGLEQVLDAVLGNGNYTLYEDLETELHTVYVLLPNTTSAISAGKTFLSGAEPQTRSTTTTVIVDNPVLQVYGVYEDTDPYREGTNYANDTFAVETQAAAPTHLFSSVAGFVAGDVGKAIVVSGLSTDAQAWVIDSFLSAAEVAVKQRARNDATLDATQPTFIDVDEAWFTAWMVGHTVKVTSVVPANTGTYVIAEVVSPFRAVLTGAAFLADTNVTWELVPAFVNAGGGTGELLRATAASATITTPVTMPTDVLVDYTHIESAQAVLSPFVSGDLPASPFYLTDAGALTQILMDLFTAGGVRVIVESE
jgi:hypothetical protein